MWGLINFLSGFITGLVIGGATGLLLAPQSGAQTREQIRTRVDEMLEEGRQAAERTRTDAQARLAELKAGQTQQT